MMDDECDPGKVGVFSMQQYVSLMKKLVVGLLIAGLGIYAAFLLHYAFTAKDIMTTGKPSYIFGLPISGVAAFAIVSVLERLAPSRADASGNLEFKAFGLSFTGPAGPVTLWIAVYLTLVASMQIVS